MSAQPEFYNIPARGVLIGGKIVMPAWARSSSIGQMIEIPGSIHSGLFDGETEASQFGPSQARLAYSGAALAGTRFILPACGGHMDSSNNAVTMIDFGQDAPAWSVLCSASASVQENVSHYADGKPSSRHLYNSAHWNPVQNRVLLYGATFVYGSAVTFPDIDGFSLDTNSWDAENTFPENGVVGCLDDDFNGWLVGPYTVERVDATTLARTTTYSNVTGFFGTPCWDSLRGQLFAICFGDGWGSGSGLSAWVFKDGCTVREAITLNASAALTQFLGDAPSYIGVQYDSLLDVFWVYGGQPDEAQNLYKITPNSGTAWDIDLHEFAAGSITLPDRGGSFVGTRFRYVPRLRGIVYMANAYDPMYYMRTHA